MNGESIFGKPWFKSMTAWGLVLWVATLAGSEAACSSSLLQPDTCQAIQAISEKVSAVLVALGIRKAAGGAT